MLSLASRTETWNSVLVVYRYDTEDRNNRWYKITNWRVPKCTKLFEMTDCLRTYTERRAQCISTVAVTVPPQS